MGRGKIAKGKDPSPRWSGAFRRSPRKLDCCVEVEPSGDLPDGRSATDGGNYVVAHGRATGRLKTIFHRRTVAGVGDG